MSVMCVGLDYLEGCSVDTGKVNWKEILMVLFITTSYFWKDKLEKIYIYISDFYHKVLLFTYCANLYCIDKFDLGNISSVY